MGPVMRLWVLRARARGVSTRLLRVRVLGAPLRARVTHNITHLDGRVGWRARELRALSEVLLRASFGCKGIP